MNLEKAIIDLSIQREVKRRLGKTYEAESLRLGIEGLKRHKEMSALVPAMPYPLLPGETKD